MNLIRLVMYMIIPPCHAVSNTDVSENTVDNIICPCQLDHAEHFI